MSSHAALPVLLDAEIHARCEPSTDGCSVTCRTPILMSHKPFSSAPLQIPSGSTDAQERARQAGVACPCIAKPQAACGVPEAHVMSIIFNDQGFGALARHQGPLVVQHFIPHAGFLHKVYVIGAKVGPGPMLLYSSRKFCMACPVGELSCARGMSCSTQYV